MHTKLLAIGLSAVIGSAIFVDIASTQQPSQKEVKTQKAKNPELEKELISIAKETVEAEYDVQVTGDIDGVKKRRVKLKKVKSEKLKERLDKAKSLREGLKERKIGYKGFKTIFQVQSIEISGDSATLLAIEDTERYFDLAMMAGGSPEKTIKVLEHKFTFQLVNNQWELVSDEILNAPGSVRGVSENPPDENVSFPEDPKILPADPLAPPSDSQAEV
jgi:hypothetical protein